MNKIATIYIVLLISVSLMMTSCAVTKEDYKKRLDIEDRYKNTLQENATGQEKAKAPKAWEDFFTDDSLRYVIKEVLANNLDLNMARQSLNIYKEYQKEANFAGLPHVNVLLGGKLDYFSDNGLYGKNGTQLQTVLGSAKIEDYAATVNVGWEVDLYGKTKNKKQIALYNRLKSEMQLKELQTQLVASAAQTYSYIQMMNNQLLITRNNLQLSQNIARMMNVQYLNGNVTKLAVQQSERQSHFVAAQIPDLVSVVHIHENYLSRLMGKNPKPLEFISKKDIIDRQSVVLGVPADLLSRRPDLKGKEYEVEIAYAELGIAKTNLYPSFNITENQGLNSMRVSDWFNPASFLSQFVGQLAQPLFNQRRNKTAVNIKKINIEQKILDFKNTYLIAVNQVSDALVKIEQIREKQKVLDEENKVLQQSLKNAQLLFTNGSALYFEVLTVQQNLLQNELQTAESQGDLNTSFIQLYKALGENTQ